MTLTTQNITGQNITGQNITGQNITGQNITGPNLPGPNPSARNLTTRISCPTCKKQTDVEISEAQFAQIRKDIALRQKSGKHDTRENRAVANSEIHFSTGGNSLGSTSRGGRHKGRHHHDLTKGAISGVNSLAHNVMVHCSGCDNLFTHRISLASLVEAEQPARTARSSSAINAHSRLYSVISNERQDTSTRASRITDAVLKESASEDSTVETLTQHFDSFSIPADISSPVTLNSARSIFGLESTGSGEFGPTIVLMFALIKRGLKIMIETTAFKLLFPSAVMLVAMMAISLNPNGVLFRTLNLFWPPEHQVPESSIFIEGTQAGEVTGMNGKRFIAVTGTIRNDGTHAVRDVIVQGLVYQADGTRIHDAVGFAHKATSPQTSNGLTDAEIRIIERSEIGQILNPSDTGRQKVITDISAIAQGNIPRRERELKAGQSQDFTVYVPVEEHLKKEDLLYSARVFAVSAAR